MTMSSIDAAKKRSRAYAHLRNCNLCPRLCGVNRYEKTGMCLIGADVVVNVIAPHFGEGTLVDIALRCVLQGDYMGLSGSRGIVNMRSIFCGIPSLV